MKKILCKILGHQFRYNFPSLPNKCICARCHKKWVADYSKDNLIWGELWNEVDEFEGETRTDEELVKELSERGYSLARRTVTKYRSLLGLQTSAARRVRRPSHENNQ